MSLHTPQSTWAKYRQPTLEIASDGIGVSLDENTYLYARWSEGSPREQIGKWFAFYAIVMLRDQSIADVLGIEPPGESSTVVSLSELLTGLDLLTRVYSQN